MFEKYVEKSRRAIFFARYEAAQHGATEIDTASLLLGILREHKSLMVRLLPGGFAELARLSEEVQALFPETTQKVATSVDLPLSPASKRVLNFAAEESERLEHQSIDARHMLLGLLKENGAEVTCLKAHGVEEEKVRADFLQDLLTDKPDARQTLDQRLDRAFRRDEVLRALLEVPEDRRMAAVTILKGLASGKFEVTGTSRLGPFHFSFDDKAE
jgi:ATP-dependent Clp protease ATP-binding subunit ClpC